MNPEQASDTARIIPFLRRPADANSQRLHPLWRDPRQYPWGVFVLDPDSFLGQDGFHWFTREQEVLDWLRRGYWAVLHHMTGNPHPDQSHYQNVLFNATSLTPSLRESLDVGEGVCVLWWGRFEQLLVELDSDITLREFLSEFRTQRQHASGSPEGIDALIQAIRGIASAHPKQQAAFDAFLAEAGVSRTE